MGYGMKIYWQDRDVLSLIVGMWNSFKGDSRVQYFNSKRLFENKQGRIGIKILKVMGWQDEVKTILDPQSRGDY